MTPHRCRFDERRHVVCTCGWRSPSAGKAGAAESFDHFDWFVSDEPPTRMSGHFEDFAPTRVK